MAQTFTPLDAGELFSPDEWVQLNERIWDHVSRSFSGKADIALTRALPGYSAQAPTLIERQEFFQFESILEKIPGARAPGFPWQPLDWLWRHVRPLIRLLRTFKKALSCGRSGVVPAAHYLIGGINPREVWAGPGQLSFSFLVERKLLPATETLYLLPIPPEAVHHAALAQAGVRWMLRDDFLSVFSWPKRLSLVFGACRIVFGGLVRNGLFSSFGWGEEEAHRFLWAQFFRFLKGKCFIHTSSTAWPEGTEVAAARTAGMSTLLWHYSANNFLFRRTLDLNFKDRSLPFSLAVTEHMAVWNKEISDLHRDRMQLREQPLPTFHEMGPMMCGNAALLADSPEHARNLSNIRDPEARLWMAVFDVPPIGKINRLSDGLGPDVYTVAMLERFFEDLDDCLKHFPTLRLLMKPKRALDNVKVDYAPAMRRLLDPHGERMRQRKIILIPHAADPYHAVAAGDVCLGLPFTSPVLAGLTSGRAGVFYDPTGDVRQFRCRSYAPWLITGAEAIKSKIKTWLDHPEERTYKRTLEDENALGPTGGDPGERLASLIQALAVRR